jgi:outer membrane protein assembly factor BamB
MYDNARSGVTGESLTLADLKSRWIYNSPAPPQRAWCDGSLWDAYSANGTVPMRDFDTAFFVTVVGDALYFGSSVTNSVHCLDARTGLEQWVFTTDGPVRFPPSYSNGKLYFGSDDGCVYGINAADGSFVWKYRPATDTRMIGNNGNLVTMWPVRSGTAVLDDKVYFAASLVPWKSTYLCAVDAASGAQVYKTSGGTGPVGAILASTDNLYLTQGRFYPQIFNRSTGASQGTISGGTGVYALLTSDGPSTGLIYGQGRENSGHGYRLAAYSDTFASVDNGKYLVVSGGVAYAITETFSVETTKGYKTNVVTQLKAINRSNGSTIWTMTCDTRRFSLMMAGNILFTGGVGKVTAHSIADGSEIWSAPVNGQVRALAAAQGRLFASSDIGSIHMFGKGFLQADFNDDGTVNLPDLDTFSEDFLKSTNPNDPQAVNLLNQ